MISLSDCQTVLAILEERHFVRAARRLGVTQPALTARLQRIEKLVGARLFDRDRGGVRPTAAGVSFIEGARATLEAAERTVMAARNAADGLGETLVLGMTQVSAHRVVRPVLRAFRQSQPKARVLLREGTTARLEAQVEGREVDLAFLHPPVHAPSLIERLILPGALIELNLTREGASHVVHFPRAEAPVLMGELARESDAAGRPSVAMADTMLGAILLSQSGYGACMVDRDFAAGVIGEEACRGAPSAGALDVSLAWRRLDRRAIVETFIAIAKEVSARLLEEAGAPPTRSSSP